MKEKSPKQKKRNRRIIIALWSAFVLGFATILLLFVLVYNGAIGYMPPVSELRNPTDKYASIIYSADGEELGRYFRNTGNRVYTDFHEISPHVVDALIATEDSRFEDHSGIDFRAFMRVFLKTLILRQKNSGGGSTITQQLAKQLYSPDSRGFMDRAFKKPVEWMIALKLERFYSKEEILKMYLNRFDFLYNAVGIQSAAEVYFNKEAKDLNVEEAAMLVGMVKNPAYYNPVRQPERTRARRNIVLDQMVKNGSLSRSDADSLKRLPITLDFHRVDHKDGPAPYFREELRRMLTSHKPDRSKYMAWEGQKFVDDSIAWDTNPLFGWIDKNPKPDGSHYDIYSDGLRIYTTIDSRMQRYAEEAVDEHMEDLQARFFREKKGVNGAPYTTDRSELSQAQLQSLINTAIRQSDRYRALKKSGADDEEIELSFSTPVAMEVFSYDGPVDTVMSPRDSIIYNKHFLRAGFMSMDPKTGHVKAYVGGPDFTHFQYDMVSTGRRQIGSTVKPFLYTLAMEEGFTPCDEMLNDQPVLVDENGRPWAPRNAGSARIGEMVTLRWALTNSNNWISARVMSQLSPTSLVRTMHNFGITNQLDPVMALCLGPCDVSVKEMVGAYTAFSNQGMRTDPLFVTAISDSNGNIISEFTPTHTEVISEDAYWKILSILLNVVDEGTGNRLRRSPYNITAQMGGKTGTTNSNSDGWFMAFTPELVSGTWVGGEERYIHFNSMANGQGASMALPIYGKYISRVYADKELPYTQTPRFEFPEDVDLCAKSSYGVYTGDNSTGEVVESIGGVFD